MDSEAAVESARPNCQPGVLRQTGSAEDAQADAAVRDDVEPPSDVPEVELVLLVVLAEDEEESELDAADEVLDFSDADLSDARLSVR
ncbi:MAG TPA: hypothetical protein VKB75_16395 [Jatrophihabitans sp.]|nr:hypothetical protein [Jatrophihabitans sp.]